MILLKLLRAGSFTLIAACMLAGCNDTNKSPDIPQTQIPKDSTSPQVNTESNPYKPPRVFLRCRSCHSYEAGKKNAVGPNLLNVFGNPAGADTNYAFSKALLESQIIWNEANLDAFLTNPSKTIPGSKMAFVGLKKEEDRKALIEWMESLNAEE